MSHRVLLITGGAWHDYAKGAEILTQTLKDAGIDVTHTEDSAAVNKLAGGQFDCLLLHLSEGTDQHAHQAFEALKLARDEWAITAALAGIHCAALTRADFDVLASKEASIGPSAPSTAIQSDSAPFFWKSFRRLAMWR